MKTLRILHVIIQPVLVEDDGEDLSPGPVVQPVTLPLTKAAAFLAAIPAEVAKLEAARQQESAVEE